MRWVHSCRFVYDVMGLIQIVNTTTLVAKVVTKSIPLVSRMHTTLVDVVCTSLVVGISITMNFPLLREAVRVNVIDRSCK